MRPGRYSLSDQDLAELCIQIQANTDRIPVRVNLRGEWETRMLADLPPALAVFFAVDLILSRVVVRGDGDDDGDADPVSAAAVEAVHVALKLLPAFREGEG